MPITLEHPWYCIWPLSPDVSSCLSRTGFSIRNSQNINRLLRKRKTINLNEITYADFDKGGVLLYREKGTKKPDFLIKFYKFGVASPVGIESFEKLCQYKGIEYDKHFTYLPGQGRFSKLCSIGYIILIVCLGINALQYLMIVLTVLMNG